MPEVRAVEGIGLHTRPSVQVDSAIVISHGNVLLIWTSTNNIDVTSIPVWRKDSLCRPAVFTGPSMELVVAKSTSQAFKIRLLDMLSLSLNVKVEQLSCFVVGHEVVAAC